MASWRGGRPDGPLSPMGFGVVVLVVAVDQIAKAIAEATLPLGDALAVLPFLDLYRVNNTGIAFSMFAGSGTVLIALMLTVTVIVVAFWMTTRDGGRLAAIGLDLILGGALGNLIDRLRLGQVVDFLLLHVGSTTLFVFNFADAALTLGPALLLVVYLWPAQHDP